MPQETAEAASWSVETARRSVEAAFEQAYAKLNPEQKQAVDALYGSYMIVAWPGTGKTQVLSARTAKILLETDTEPQNILITTFTDAGVVAIKKRLQQFVGNASYKVNVTTLHSLAKDIIESYPEYFLQYRALSPMDELEAYEYIESILNPDDFPDLCPLYTPGYWIPTIVSNIKKLREEWVMPDQMQPHIDGLRQTYVQELWEIDPKLKKYANAQQKQLLHLAKLTQLTEIYSRFESRKKQLGKYDFSDMILHVSSELAQNDMLASEIAERFQFVMVDEFQDLSNSQNMLVEGILRMSDHPNILTVGDDDQSIYRFQGANLENMLHFSQKFENTKIIVLSSNYRSGQSVLDAATSLIDRNSTRLSKLIPTLQKPLNSGLDRNSTVEVIGYRDKDAEMTQILSSIQAKLKSGIPSQEIAILTRTNREVSVWCQLLTGNGIPVQSREKSNLFQSEEFLLLEYLLRITVGGKIDSYALIEILRTGLIINDRVGLYRLTRSLEEANYRLPRKLELFEAILEPTLLEAAVRERIGDWESVKNKVLELRSIDQSDLVNFFTRFEEILGLKDFIRIHNGISGLERLYRIYEIIQEGVRSGRHTNVENILTHWNRMRQFKMSLKGEETGDGKGVQVLTTHQSKGLEYHTVFIPGVLDGDWGNRRNRDLLPLPASITGAKLETEDLNEEERRLFFVAVTRAEEHLAISFPESSRGKAKVKSEFIDELAVPISQSSAFGNPEVLLQSSTNSIFRLKMEDADAEYIESFLKNYRLSPSDLSKFMADPELFLQSAILRYPFEDTPKTIFGTCYHSALELFFKAWKAASAMPTLDFLFESFEKKVYWQFLSPEQRRDILERGKTGLEGWYAMQTGEQPLPLAMEYSTGKLLLEYEGIPIKGKIDRIDEIEPGILRVIDYKTGTPKSENNLKWGVADGDGAYYRQLLFYKLMLEQDPKWKSHEIRELAVWYVEGKEGKYPLINFAITPEEESVFKVELLDAWKKISDISWWREFLNNKASSPAEEEAV